MFVRQKKNKSGSVSVQIISKHTGSYKVFKTVGSSVTPDGINLLLHQAQLEIHKHNRQSSLFTSQQDALIESFLGTLRNTQVQVIGPELVFGKIYDAIGFNQINEELFRHLVISRLAFPLSKLKTIDYLYRYQGIELNINTVYRFLDKLHSRLKDQVEHIAYQHTLKLVNDDISIVFYDMTTLYFEASDEDDLRKAGFSKDGKHQNPQIYLGLLVSLGGYLIGYDIFEGSIYEGHTLLPVLEKLSLKFQLPKPMVIADAGLLSKSNIALLEQQGYHYILGARLRNEAATLKNELLSTRLKDGEYSAFNKTDGTRLIIAYSEGRAAKDAHNRRRGLQRLEKQVKSGKLTKAHINNKGYNKYLKMKGDVIIEIDYTKYELDAKWDGLKGYVTNSKLNEREIINNYKNLWQIEKAFRMSKTDLRIRPIYHRVANRIEAHICISFSAYTIYKELERLLYQHKAPFSVKKAAELTQTMYQLKVILPESKKQQNIIMQMDSDQELLRKMIKNYSGCPKD